MKTPQGDDEVALAMMLSGDFLPPDKLAAAAAAIKSGQRLELPPKMRAAVLSAMKAARKRSAPAWWIPWIKPAAIVGIIAVLFHP
jgi:sugar/nucleoside kinase (ribokinase family)